MPYDMTADEALDRRIGYAEQRLANMRELTEIGMVLARDLMRRTISPRDAATDEATPAPRRDPADAYARLSRAIRLTLTLEAKAEDQLSALIAGVKAPDASESFYPIPYLFRDQAFPGDLPCPKRNRIRNAVFDTVDREVTGHEMHDYDLANDILETSHDGLAEGGQFGAFIDLPLKEAVEAVFGYFKMKPDLSHWTEDGPPPSARTPAKIWRHFWDPRIRPRLQ